MKTYIIVAVTFFVLVCVAWYDMRALFFFIVACYTVSALAGLLHRLLLAVTHQRFDKVGKTTRANS
jgi:hypothetical protein